MSDAFDCQTSVEMRAFGVQQKVLFAVEEKIPEKQKSRIFQSN